MTSKPRLRVALAQCDIVPCSPLENLKVVEDLVARYARQADLVVFPETITTGFAREATAFADSWGSGEVFVRLKALAQRHDVAICGSYLAKTEGGASNRFFLFAPDGTAQWQDKRHLFSLGGEPEMISSSSERKVFELKGWRILPIVCYDLRFPVWCRCVDCEYDLIICVANWPKARRQVWTTLLKARAMENLAYVVGVNRIGTDPARLSYSGDSVALSPRGEVIAACTEDVAEVVIAPLEAEPLAELRAKFPVWRDADSFTLHL
ncbi:MAG: nitrilase-related carbon-nitrogen hydrolase [Porphyromonadaceae bacterium]|nr:nitrilase-related carbon-nitrogen hydrolase [Porphyromonadaceae bacterium]